MNVLKALGVLVVGFATIALIGCDRLAGQAELFTINNAHALTLMEDTKVEPRSGAVPTDGMPIQSNDDDVTLYVESVNLNHLPFRLSGSKDIAVFVEVWENAAATESLKPLTRVIYSARNQLIPGKLNLFDKIAYGPTKFKGHPINIRFTILVLQKKTTEEQAGIISLLGGLASAAQPQVSPAISLATSIARDTLLAQPDVDAFDFDMVLQSDAPEGLKAVLNPTISLTGARSRNPRPPATTNGTLQYGKYALIETIGYNGTTEADGLNGKTLPALTYARGQFWAGEAPIKRNYIVFRFDPKPIAEPDDVLKATSDANIAALDSMRRTPEQAQQALQSLINSTAQLRDIVWSSQLDSKAADLARKFPKDKDKFVAAFDQFVASQSATISVAEDKAAYKKVADAIKEKWVAKFPAAPASPAGPGAPPNPDPSAPTPPAPTPPALVPATPGPTPSVPAPPIPDGGSSVPTRPS